MDLKEKLSKIPTSDLSVYFIEVEKMYRKFYENEKSNVSDEDEDKEKISKAFFVLKEEIEIRVNSVINNIDILL